MTKKTSTPFINSIVKTTWLPIIAFLICLPAMWPLFNSQFFHMHDFTHVARLSEMHRALQDGHFPVRWSQNFGFGYGMPLFNFYGPLPFYIGSILVFLGFSYIGAVKGLFIITFLSSFVSMYLLAKHYWSKSVALVAATAFIYLPYRAVDMYVRGALNELFAISLIPFAILSLIQTIKSKHNKWVIISGISLAGIIMSHNLATLMAFPLIGFLILGLILSQNSINKLVSIKRLFIVLLITLGLSAFYTLPSLLEKGFTRVNALTEGYFDYAIHFLFAPQLWDSPWDYGGSIGGIEDGISFELGKPQIILILMGLALVIYRRKQLSKEISIIIFLSLIILLFTLFMTSTRSIFIWQSIPFLSYSIFLS